MLSNTWQNRGPTARTTTPPTQCVTAVDPEWLAEMGPMFFSVKETHSSRLEQRQKVRGRAEGTPCPPFQECQLPAPRISHANIPIIMQERTARAVMEGELEKSQAEARVLQAAQAEREAAIREKQRKSIATPGSARPGTGQRKFGL